MSNEIDFEKLVRLFERTQNELQQQAARSIDTSLVVRNWLFGWYISEFEQKGEDRAKYASMLIKRLANSLKAKGLKGLSATNLKQFRSFYLCYKTIGQSLPDQSEFTDLKGQSPSDLYLNQKSNVQRIVHEVSKALQIKFSLSWTHYVSLLTLSNQKERHF